MDATIRIKMKKYGGLCAYFAIAIASIISQFATLSAQNYASPANWLYPQGGANALRNVSVASFPQNIDSLNIKWATGIISGHVKPLIGNFVNNDKIFPHYTYAPNEILAVVGDRLVVLDGSGKPIYNSRLPETVRSVYGASVLLDTNALDGQVNAGSPIVLALESMEAPAKDSLAVSYIVGFNETSKKPEILRRLSINLREASFYPNVSASLKPVYSVKSATGYFVYGLSNMSKPSVSANPPYVEAPFLRGLSRFNAGNVLANFPLPDVGDEKNYRTTLGPEVSFTQPSVAYNGTKTQILMPCYPTPGLTGVIPNSTSASGTEGEKPYLMSFDLTDASVAESFPIYDLSSIVKGTRPRIRPFYADIRDQATEDSSFIILAEEYMGRDGSLGYSKLHLFSKDGMQLTSSEKITEPPYLPPSYVGGTNNYWSVAVGDVDGSSINEWLPYFPNNKGKEIIVTNSSEEFAVAGSKLSILRYNSGPQIEKPTPPGEYLFPLDTICTQDISGRVVCVNDFDGDTRNGKAEIFLADGSKIIVLRLRDYTDVRFRMGMHFDTVFVKEFPNQTISNAAVADVDGDGLNDLVVSTFDSTYVIGTLATQTIAIESPKYAPNMRTDYCKGDSLNLVWRNTITNGTAVNILFVPVVGGYPRPDMIKYIGKNVSNMKDKETFKYIVDDSTAGYSGFFLIHSVNNPTRNYDTTTILNFNKPTLTLDEVSFAKYYSGVKTNITGTATCADSVAYEISSNGTEWMRLGMSTLDTGGKFSIEATFPCIGTAACSNTNIDTTILRRYIVLKGNQGDTSSVAVVKLGPATIDVTIDTTGGISPTKIFTWAPEKFKFQCDTIAILASLDFGASYFYLDIVPAYQRTYSWLVPTSAPDSVIIRFCGVNSCMRMDTIVRNVIPKYIKTVAPNPFRYPEYVQVVYTVPNETIVNIRIYDQANRMVAEPVKGEQRSPGIYYSDKWDGLLPNGSPAANGMYYLSVELSDGSLDVYSIFIRK